MDIKIKTIQNRCDEDPKFSFTPTLRGQACYIMAKCEEKEIRTEYMMGDIRIFSHKKLELFKSIIQDSFMFHKNGSAMQMPIQSYTINGSIICVGIKSEDCLYCFESSMARVIENQFIGKIPMTMHYKIYNMKKEMEEDFLRKGILI
jgi:hypothetical protein